MLVVNPDGSVSVYSDPNVGQYDGSDDTMVGILSNYSKTVNAVTVTGPGTGLSEFDGDGLCTFISCSYPAPTGYEGPANTFTTDNSLPDSAEVDFTGGLAPGASTYFSLEGALTSAVLTARRGTLANGYVALGDSYSSGEGNGPFLTGTDVKGVNTCHRSSDAYPELLAQDLGNVNLSFVACSGATTGNVWNSSDPAESTSRDPEPLQIDSLSPATRLVTITIGGNDVHFADVIKECVIWTCGAAKVFSSLLKNLPARITALGKTLTATYEAIKQAAPNAEIYVLGYPDILPPRPSVLGNTATCVRSGLDLGSLGWLAPKQAQLQQVIQNSAAQAGVHYVDPNAAGKSYSFVNHGICARDSWVIGLIGRHPLTQSFHPTKTGQFELEQALLDNGIS
jgi:hypothetical protein